MTKTCPCCGGSGVLPERESPEENLLRELSFMLSYDPLTGRFFWVIRRSKRAMAGTPAGTVDPKGYIYIKYNQRRYAAHRLAWLFVHRKWPNGVIDHINGDRADNRLSNLREATWAQNNINRPGWSKYGFKGIYRKKNNVRQWRAMIGVGGGYKTLGSFATKEEANEAYNKAAKEIYGDFAWTK